MPNKNNNITTEQEIQLLTKALQRQRNVNKKLQERISAKENVNYNNQKELIDALSEAKSRQNQLELLSYIANDLNETSNLLQFFKCFIEQINKLVMPCDALIFHKNPNKNLTLEHFQGKELHWSTTESKLTKLTAFDFLSTLECKQWIRYNQGEHSCLKAIEQQLQAPMYLVLPFIKYHDSSPIILLGIEHFCYDDEFKNMLGTVAMQFAEQLRKRQTKIQLEQNYQTLQQTLRELTTTQQQLQHNEKLAALGVLSAGVAHEINNPMAYLRSNLETLTEYTDIYERALEANVDKKYQDEDLDFARNDMTPLLSSCVEGIERISDIVKSLKAFSKREDENFSPVNIHQVIEKSLLIVKNKFSKHHQIEVNFCKKAPIALGDFGQLQQVFVNLFINAIHAMVKQGQLTIHTSIAQQQIQIQICDTGIGMDIDTLKHLFDPFFTTKNDSDQDGTGLGLSVSYAILQKHNAKVDVTSKLNQGSTFMITLPRYQL